MKKAHGRGFIWTSNEEKKLSEIYKKTSLDRLVSIFGRSESAIREKARKLGLKRDGTARKYNREWTAKEEAYLVENYEFGNVNEIAYKLNRTRKAITERAKLLKITRDKELVRKNCRKHKINEDFFKQMTSNSAYILGLICADGNVSKTSNAISICLHKDDSYLLEDISSVMSSSYSVRFDKNMSTLGVESKPLHEDLVKLGIMPNKSKTIEAPEIPEKYMPDFIRGVIDGDGSVSKRRPKVKISTASKKFAKDVSHMLHKIGVYNYISYEPYTWKGKKKDFYNILIMRRDAVKKLYHHLYDNAELFMVRKKERFVNIGVESEDFSEKCVKHSRPITATNDQETRTFKSVTAAQRSGFPSVKKALKTGKKYKGYTWRYVNV